MHVRRGIEYAPRGVLFLIRTVAAIALGLAILLLSACQATPEPTIVYPTATVQFIPNFQDNPTAPPPTAATLPSATPNPRPSATPLQPTEGGAITIGVVGDPSFEGSSLPRWLADALYDTLLEFDPGDGSPQPGLAESWEVSADGRTFVFHLRKDVRWHDGQALTAADVVFTINSLSNARSRLTPVADFGPLDTVTAPDALTVRVTLKSPYCPALANLGGLRILPQHTLDKQNLAQLSLSQLIGSGPLKFVEYKPGISLKLTRNPSYWQGVPHILDWTYRIFPDTEALSAAAAAGQIDLFEYDTARGDLPQATDAWRVYGHPSNGFYGLVFNESNPALADVRVRRALGLAIDREALVQEVFGGHAYGLGGNLLPDFWAGANVDDNPLDLALARQSLSAAGWTLGADGVQTKDGKPLSISLWAIADDPIWEPLAVALRDMLDSVGVRAQLKLDDRGNWLTRVLAHEYDLTLVQWNLTLDPDQTYLWNSRQNDKGNGFNFGSYSNPRVDDWLQQGIQASGCDPKARQGLYAQITQQLVQDSPYAFLLAPERGLLARSTVAGLQPSAFAGEYWNLSAWFLTR